MRNGSPNSARSGALGTLAALALLTGCAGAPGPQFCRSDTLLIDQNFAGGNFAACRHLGDNRFDIEIRPEDDPPINVSPWYALRLSASADTTADITLRFIDGYARYWPKRSVDARRWRRLPESEVTFDESGDAMMLSVPVTTRGVYVSGQELLTDDWYQDWFEDLRTVPGVSVRLLGESRSGRPLLVASTEARRRVVLLLGRQHPPEVSGAIAMRPFVATVLGDGELARRFRARFQVIVVPLLNPDGVANGHWRHNEGSTDLNRDWGPFTQPETRSVRDLLVTLGADGGSPVLMLDFHSTKRNVFYTQTPEDFAPGDDFAADWLDAARARLPDFDFERSANPPSGQANAKNYFFERYGIPSITYELGDETDRGVVRASAPVFAEEMMRLMLARHEDDGGDQR